MSTRNLPVRFEVFTAVTMKNGVFWVVTRFLQEPHGVTTQKTPFFRNLPGWRGQLACEADNLTHIRELLYGECGSLNYFTIILASTACYKSSFSIK
jgi:hypothetical protein